MAWSGRSGALRRCGHAYRRWGGRAVLALMLGTVVNASAWGACGHTAAQQTATRSIEDIRRAAKRALAAGGEARRLYDLTRALTSLHEAIDRFCALVTRGAASDDDRLDLIRALTWRGMLYGNRLYMVGARADLDEALSIVRASPTPGNTAGVRYLLARAQAEGGVIAAASGYLAAAESSAAASQPVLEEDAARDARLDEGRVAALLLGMGTAVLRGDSGAAAEKAARAVPIARRVSAADPTVLSREDLATLLTARAEISLRLGDVDGAERAVDEAIGIGREILAASPHNPDLARNLADFLLVRGLVELRRIDQPFAGSIVSSAAGYVAEAQAIVRRATTPHDMAAMELIAQIHSAKGQIAMVSADPPAALASFVQMLAAARVLRAADESPATLRLLATALSHVVEARAMRRMTAAADDQDYRELQALVDGAETDDQPAADLHLLVLRAEQSIAVALMRDGARADAVPVVDALVQRARWVVQRFPRSSAENRLWTALIVQGDVRYGQGDLTGALRVYREALDLIGAGTQRVWAKQAAHDRPMIEERIRTLANASPH